MGKKAGKFEVILLLVLPLFAGAQTGTTGGRTRLPLEERAVSDFDLGVNKVNYVHARFPELNGEGLAASVKEQRMDSTDIDFRGRHIPSDIAASLVNTHSTTMATIIAGGGNSYYTGKGVAWKAGLSSSSFFNLFPDDPSYFRSSSLTVQNHSYGLDIENFYGAEAEAYDRQVYDYPEMVHVFSAGNRGDSASSEGPYAGVEGFANLTGAMKMAKNVLTVGAVDSFYRLETRSSRGPAYDGRIKPELVAFGQDGSSGAAAISSGTVLLLQQAFRDRHDGALPEAALLRAVLLNSADDLGETGPDFLHGFGNLDAAGAVQAIVEERFFRGVVAQGDLVSFRIEVPDAAVDLKITLAWTDPPAAVSAGAALVNDLDLSLAHLPSGEEWAPWVLNSFPSSDSLSLPAKRGVDRLNNQEQISIAGPRAGTYSIRIDGRRIPEGVQEFYIAYEWGTANHVEWTFPGRLDNLRPGDSLLLRWESTLPGGESGQIEYALSGSEEWKIVDEQVDLSQRFWKWAAPDTLALAQLRLTAGDLIVLSDTFTVSRPMELKVEFDCDDERLLSFKSLKGAAAYQLFSLDADYLEPVLLLSDTFVVLDKSTYPSGYFAVAPMIRPDRRGMLSPTLNTAFQQTGCYVNNFLAELDGEQAALTLTLSTLYQVESVFFEKRAGDGFLLLASRPAGAGLTYRYEDIDLQYANNYYRAGVILEDGTVLYSDEARVFFLAEKAYALFPNPVIAGQDIIVLTEGGFEATQLHLYDAVGRLVLRIDLLSPAETLETINLAPGIYFYRIGPGKENRASGKIMVR